jgi:hypothetical protein
MSTRSLTIVRKNNNRDSDRIITMYRQSDGYPSGHGKDLADFLSKIKMVNGISMERESIANGVACLAAQIVAHFKTEPGGIYLHAGSDEDAPGAYSEEYTYEVFADTFKPQDGITMIVKDGATELFAGKPTEYEAWLLKYSEQE